MSGRAVKNIIAVKPGDSFDHWHQVTCRDYSVTECRRVTDRQFRARIAIREFGAFAMSALSTATPPDELIHETRSPEDIRRDPRDHFMLWLMLRGDLELAQNGRSARMRAGDLFVYDQSRPFALNFGRRSEALMITIPRPLLISRAPMAHRFAGCRIAGDSSVGALAGTLVRQLARLDETTDGELARRLGSSALDILAATFESELGREADSARHQQRFAEVKRHILANLRDPNVKLAQIAASQNMAPRTLYRLFAGESTTPMRWLWQQRLAASFKALAEGEIATVTDAALSFGFSNPSHFSRAFKAAFGQPPRVLRRRKIL